MPLKNERPICRQAVAKMQLDPFIVNGVWDGLTYRDENGNPASRHPSKGLRTQIRKMVEEGHWGPVTIKKPRSPRQPRYTYS